MEKEIWAWILGLYKAKAKNVIVSVIVLKNRITLYNLFLSKSSGYRDGEPRMALISTYPTSDFSSHILTLTDTISIHGLGYFSQAKTSQVLTQ